MPWPINKPVKARMPQYLRWQVTDRVCCRCRARKATEAHHESVTGGKGMSTKPSDVETLGLCFECHRERDNIPASEFYPYRPPAVMMLEQLNEYLHERKIK